MGLGSKQKPTNRMIFYPTEVVHWSSARAELIVPKEEDIHGSKTRILVGGNKLLIGRVEDGAWGKEQGREMSAFA